MNKRTIRLIAIAIMLSAVTVGSLQAFAGPRKGGKKGGGCMNWCMGSGGSVQQCRSICGR